MLGFGIVKLEEVIFRRIQVAILKRQLSEIHYMNSNNEVNKLLGEAGLEANKNYKMNEETFEIDENVGQVIPQ